MRFAQAFDLAPGDVIAFVGAGGKTSLLVSLGYELAEAGWRVLATTTAQMTEDQLALFPCALPASSDAAALSQALNEKQFVLLYDRIQGGKVFGPDPEWARQILDSIDSDFLLVEADTADGLPFKAPLAEEPRIPPETSLVVSVASLSALGKPLNDEHVYNPRAMIDRYGFAENSPIKSPWLAQVLRDEVLGLRGIPPEARVLIFLNQTPERGYVRGRARMIARLSLQSERISAVALGSVRGAEPVYELQRSVGALVLATGGATCGDLGAALQPIGSGKGSLAMVAEQLLRSRIDHIRVVTGFRPRDVKRAIKHLGIKAVNNRAWKSGGVVSALKAGLTALPAHAAAALVVPCRPQRLPPKLVYNILTAYARCDGEFIVSRAPGQMDQPVLIARKYWDELLGLPRNYGLLEIIDHFQTVITYLDTDASGVFHSVDKAERMPRGRWPASLKDLGL